MPFVALLDGSVRVDLTRTDDAVWDAIYKAKPPAKLTCRGCSGRMHAKARSHTRFFAHHVRQDDCPTAGESPEHLRLKRLLVDAARAAGWEANPEEPVGGRWADVLAVSPDGQRRVALEVQLSPQTAAVTTERTADYAGVDVEVIWVVHDEARIGRWEDGPYLVLAADDLVSRPTARLDYRNEEWRIGRRTTRARAPRWKASDQAPSLDAMIASVLSRGAVWHHEGATWVPSGQVPEYDRALEDYAAAEAKAERDRIAEQERWDRNQQQWLERRARTATGVAGLLDAAGHGPSETRDDKVIKRAYAALVTTPAGLRVFVCPVATAVSVGRAWRQLNSGYAVVAENEREAQTLRRQGLKNVTTLESLLVPDVWLLPSTADGRPASPAESSVWKQVQKLASWARAELTEPVWSNEARGWSVTGSFGVSILMAAEGAAPRTIPPSTTTVVYARKRDAEHAGPTAVGREDLTVEHLMSPESVQRRSLLDVTPRQAVVRRIEAEPAPVTPTPLTNLLEAVHEVVDLAPKRSSPSYATLRGDDPQLGKVVRFANAPHLAHIVVTDRAGQLTALETRGRVLLNLGPDVPTHEAIAHVSRPTDAVAAVAADIDPGRS